jgi:hypothetical protein
MWYVKGVRKTKQKITCNYVQLIPFIVFGSRLSFGEFGEIYFNFNQKVVFPFLQNCNWYF